jgi:poly-gamma-glutamate system protein
LKRLLSKAHPWTLRADVLLVCLALIGIGFQAIAESTRRLAPQSDIREKTAAATRTIRCFEAIRQQRMGTPAAMDRENDPEKSGLIGQEFTLTTTDRGVLEAKLTSVNPNFAAIFVKYFRELKLKPGDPVAIAMTGSFPALNIAALAAAQELGLKAIPITSVGASMWGANDPKFTWLDMEKLLVDAGLLETRSVAASIGGSNDRGRGLSPRGRDLLRDAIAKNDVPLIQEPTLDEAIERRIEIYDREAGPIGVKAYVNLGGSSVSIGTRIGGELIPPGVNRRLKTYNWTQRGVLHHYASQGVPTIHMQQIEAIAEQHGLPIAPEVIPAVGEGEIFYREMYDLRIVVPAFLTFLVLCFGVLRSRHQAAVRGREESALAAEADEPSAQRSDR